MSERRDGPEYRVFRRGPSGVVVRYGIKSPPEACQAFGPQERDAVANDISEGGLALFTDCHLPPGAILNLRFRLSSPTRTLSEDGSRNMALQGEVRHSRLYEGKITFLVGVKFVRLSEKDRAFIASCL